MQIVFGGMKNSLYLCNANKGNAVPDVDNILRK